MILALATLLLAQRFALEWYTFLVNSLQQFLARIFICGDLVNVKIRTLRTETPALRAFNSQRNKDCKPGPKSRHQISVLLATFCSIWMSLQYVLEYGSSGRVEGCTSAMRSAETPEDWTYHFMNKPGVKLHGSRPHKCETAPNWLNPPKASKVVKRSLYRAQRRSQRLGMTWYRGQCLTQNGDA